MSGTRRWQAAAITALTAYALLLVLAAWPDALLPSFAEPPRRGARWLLDRARLRAGQAVFLGMRPTDDKIRAWCITVLGGPNEGPLEAIYRPTDECFPRSVVWRRDRWFQTFQELLNAAGKTWTVRDGERVNAIYSLIADYFCHSPLAGGRSHERISIVEHRVFKSYSTGAVTGQLIHTYSWSCVENAPAPQPWPDIPVSVVLGPTVR